ncbi:MAG: hypothetical protein IKQ55_04475 [Kiritimatiellae bacterium]|nr:hypothetical protein [Kiritimatiellia bacterium]
MLAHPPFSNTSPRNPAAIIPIHQIPRRTKVFQSLEKYFPIIGKPAKNFSNHWKKRVDFSNHWKLFFQSLENSVPGAEPAGGPEGGAGCQKGVGQSRYQGKHGKNPRFFRGGKREAAGGMVPFPMVPAGGAWFWL